MRSFEDNDIEILGIPTPNISDGKKARVKLYARMVIGLVILFVIISLFFILRKDESVPTNDLPESSEITTIQIDSIKSETVLPPLFTDSINDVIFTIVPLDGLHAEVSFEKPDSLAGNVVFAAVAADHRADNGEIVGEFIYNRQLMSRGTRKSGYCYVSPDGLLSIGIGSGEEAKKLALKEGGTFFRQYALVMDGEMQPNTLKGKAKRRALGFLDNKPVAVLTTERESIYDFSQALADYGLSHAIYLPGGNEYLAMQATQWKKLNSNNPPRSTFENYIIFTK